MAGHEPPAITLVTPPITHTTTSSYTISGRRNRNANAANANNNLRPTTSREDGGALEPFPSAPSSMAVETPSQAPHSDRTNDYFPQTPLQYQVRQRPIGIRRLTSSNDMQSTDLQRQRSNSGLRRRRTNTGPREQQQQLDNATASLAGLPGHYEIGNTGNPASMGTIVEGLEAHHGENPNQGQDPHRQSAVSEGGVGRSGSTRLRRASNAARSVLSKLSDDPEEDNLRRGRPQSAYGRDYESDVVDYLDVLDPEISTLTTLNNVQNSLFVPDIPWLNRYYNRRPTYELTRGPSRQAARTESHEPGALRPQVSRQISRQLSHKPMPPTPGPPAVPPKTHQHDYAIRDRRDSRTSEPGAAMGGTDDLDRRLSLTSHVEDDHYAVLPHGVSLEGWSEDDVEILDDYVRHMLHSRRSRFKRSMRGFGKYVRKPLGFFVTLYAFLITAFGLIWVLCLIGWLSLPGDRKSYIIHIVDSVLVGLFAIMGDGLAPFRCVDTYHMIYIAHYHRLSWKLRKQRNLPRLANHNDLPERTQKEVCADAEAGIEKETDADWEFSVLTPEQQRKLAHHQNKFSKSHSYYRPHETTTHHAFPLKLLIAIVSLLDAHSILQISLGAFTWGWSYHTRPEWITAVILSISITVNIAGGVLITVGDKRTRKKDVLLRMARQGLTEEAMRKVEKKKREIGAEEEAERIKHSVDMARLANIRHGVRSPSPVKVKADGTESDDSGEFAKGTKELKDKLRPYASLSEEEREVKDRDGHGHRTGQSWKGEGSSEVAGDGYRTASEERHVGMAP